MLKDKYDIVIVGSGAGAGPIAYEMSKAGKKVLVLEKGPWFKTEDFFKDEIVTSRRSVYTPNLKDEPQVIEELNAEGEWKAKSNSVSGRDFWNGSVVGGSSNFMSGYFHRMKPVDFTLLSSFGKIEGANIVDWPISYDDLEPYYDKVEKIVGVSGEARKHSSLEPRSSLDFPFPPLKENIISSWIDEACRKEGYESVRCARSIISSPKNERTSCSYSHYCGSYGCSTGAKGSSRVALLDEALKTGNLDISAFSKVFYLKSDAGKVTEAHFYDKNGEVKKVSADIFVVAGQAIESTRLLLMSKSDEFPDGLANNNGLLGKNLIFSGGGVGSGDLHKRDLVEVDFEELLKPGVFVNRSIQNWYSIDDVDFGIAKGGTVDFLFEHSNPTGKAIRQKWNNDGSLLYGSELKKKMKYYFTQMRKISFEVFNDWLPTDNCFVTLDSEVKDKWGDNVARIRISNHKQDIIVGEFLAEKAEIILKNLGAKNIKSNISGGAPPNLVAGGCRFGNDKKTSVLDKNCKAHEVGNLYVTDASFMPTGGSVPYTWTIYANSFRVADEILKKYM
ncbi:MAG: GMC family oxidoreductase [Flavobacteriales bacterium]|nr:GMC family oxidoreductase [Flavobacteriales bacterium]